MLGKLYKYGLILSILVCGLPVMAQQNRNLTRDKVKSAAQIENKFWARIKNSKNPEDFRSYLKEYPDGAFAPFAKTMLRNIRR